MVGRGRYRAAAAALSGWVQGKSGTRAEGVAAAEPQFTRLGRSLNGLQVVQSLAGEPTVKQILGATWWTFSITAAQISDSQLSGALGDQSLDFILSSPTPCLQTNDNSQKT